MGTAMNYAVSDFKYLVGMKDHNSDDEENANNDNDDYQNMSMLKKKYLRRKDSD